MKLTEYERGFIEACIDTDGSIFIEKHKNQKGTESYYPVVSFSNNSVKLLNKIKKILKVNNKLILKKGSKNYKFAIKSHKALNLLKSISLVVKEEKRLKLIRLGEISTSRYGRNQYDREFLDQTKKEIEKILGNWYE